MSSSQKIKKCNPSLVLVHSKKTHPDIMKNSVDWDVKNKNKVYKALLKIHRN